MTSDQSGRRHKQNTQQNNKHDHRRLAHYGKKELWWIKKYCVGMVWGECDLAN